MKKNTTLKMPQPLLLMAAVVLIQACSDSGTNQPQSNQATTQTTAASVQAEQYTAANHEDVQNTKQLKLDNTQYLYVVDEHSVDELEKLLRRADEIATNSLDNFGELEVAMILHGPSVDLFRQRNYSSNKRLIDLAAKLDAFNVIDIKICESSMSQFEVGRGEVPAFIESVPFAPDEMKRLRNEGYINL